MAVARRRSTSRGCPPAGARSNAGSWARIHLSVKAVTTVTDQGTFEAVISTEDVDRELDVVDPEAMATALQKWNRPIPLAWNHSTKAEDILGHIDPESVQVVCGEVVASGQVDLDSRVGGEAWRSFKSRTIGFGVLILDGVERRGGGRHITELDVFEVTATPTPMNNATRVLSTKAMAEYDRVRTKARDSMFDLLLSMPDEPSTKAAEPECKSTGPVQVATFEC